jgi:hypothetical protein
MSEVTLASLAANAAEENAEENGSGTLSGASFVRLVGQVIRVSVETVKIVNGLPQKFA